MTDRQPHADPQPPHQREANEPEELHNPVPPALLILFFALIGWGFWYYLATPAAPMNAGDTRTPLVADAGGAADGAAVYAGNCVACHQSSGQGIPGAFPPLAAARWVVTDTIDIPIQILLHGMNGPIEVAGKVYNGVMPGFGQLSDAEIAAVLTYIRQNWNNDASIITADDIARNREATADRNTPWNGGQSLEARYGKP